MTHVIALGADNLARGQLSLLHRFSIYNYVILKKFSQQLVGGLNEAEGYKWILFNGNVNDALTTFVHII